MKKAKIVASICALIIAVCIFSFGVYAATSVTLTISSTITYVAPDADLDIIMNVNNNKGGFTTLYYTTNDKRNEHEQSANYTKLPEKIENINLQFDELNTELTPTQRITIEIVYTVYNYNTFDMKVFAEQIGTNPTGFTITPDAQKTISKATTSNEKTTPGSNEYKITLNAGTEPTVGQNNLNLKITIEPNK